MPSIAIRDHGLVVNGKCSILESVELEEIFIISENLSLIIISNSIQLFLEQILLLNFQPNYEALVASSTD